MLQRGLYTSDKMGDEKALKRVLGALLFGCDENAPLAQSIETCLALSNTHTHALSLALFLYPLFALLFGVLSEGLGFVICT